MKATMATCAAIAGGVAVSPTLVAQLSDSFTSTAKTDVVFASSGDTFTILDAENNWNLVLQATVQASILVSNPALDASGDASYEVGFANVTVSLVDPSGGVSPLPKVISLGTLSGTVTDLPDGGTTLVNLGPTSGFVTAVLAGLPSGRTPQVYTVQWNYGEPFLNEISGKEGVIDSSSIQVSGTLTVPEPSEYALMAGLGLLGFACWRSRRS